MCLKIWFLYIQLVIEFCSHTLEDNHKYWIREFDFTCKSRLKSSVRAVEGVPRIFKSAFIYPSPEKMRPYVWILTKCGHDKRKGHNHHWICRYHNKSTAELSKQTMFMSGFGTFLFWNHSTSHGKNRIQVLRLSNANIYTKLF